ncbi:MAG: MBL fold metallo-hydrolase [Negativicutes bacterium]|nr:MBL fold metallo-hydrolase [Negativicutes bacterium]
MKVVCLKANLDQYSCSSYLILGDWNRLEDVNTLIDAGVDGFVLAEIAGLSTGVGKRPVEQLILTHGHFDHCAGAKFIKRKYSCLTLGFSSQKPVDQTVRDGQILRCGDHDFEVIHTPGHSGDSICLYCEKEAVLFSGDTQLVIRTPGGCYTEEFVESLERLGRRRIIAVYPGHGTPLRGNVGAMIADTLRNVHKSQINSAQ